MKLDINQEDYHLRRISQIFRKMEMSPYCRAAENQLKKKTPKYNCIILYHNI